MASCSYRRLTCSRYGARWWPSCLIKYPPPCCKRNRPAARLQVLEKQGFTLAKCGTVHAPSHIPTSAHPAFTRPQHDTAVMALGVVSYHAVSCVWAVVPLWTMQDTGSNTSNVCSCVHCTGDAVVTLTAAVAGPAARPPHTPPLPSKTSRGGGPRHGSRRAELVQSTDRVDSCVNKPK